MPNKIDRLKQIEFFYRKLFAIKIQKFSGKKSFWMLVFFYFIYLTKSAFGINISDKYTAPKFFKAPLTTIDCVFHMKGNFCPTKAERNQIILKVSILGSEGYIS